MPISMVLRKENGEEIIRAEHAYVPADESLDEISFPLLSCVDPYANTIYNTRQMGRLLMEVEKLLGVVLSEEERTSLEAVAELCHEGRRVHRFLWFIGD